MDKLNDDTHGKKVQIFCVFGNAPQKFISFKRVILDLSRKYSDINFIVQHGATEFQSNEFSKNLKAFSYCDKDAFITLIETSNFIFGHCGVGVILQCAHFSKPFFGLPRLASKNEHVDEHQSDLFKKLINRNVIYKLEEFSNDVLYSPVPKMNFLLNSTEVFKNKKILGICSIGGHRDALVKTLEDNGLVDNLISIFVDEKNFSMGSNYTVVKSCSKKRYYFIRVFQAIFLVRKVKPDIIYTTGAGVGFVYVVAARLLGIPTICQESLTRIYTESKWFKYARLLSNTTISSEYSNLKTDLKFNVFK